MSVIIVDYGLGNLRSVYNACVFLGAEPRISSDPHEIEDADKIILPGVGAFGDTLNELRSRNLSDPIVSHIEKGKPYFGICLGLQILFEKSEESPDRGLGIFKGEVKKFRRIEGCKIPHMGWNSVKVSSVGERSGLFEETGKQSYFYFVHSFYAKPEDEGIIAGFTEYAGENFASCLYRDNIYATQFHPERSQDNGLKLLRFFLNV